MTQAGNLMPRRQRKWVLRLYAQKRITRADLRKIQSGQGYVEPLQGVFRGERPFRLVTMINGSFWCEQRIV